jgi:transcriptional regulator
MYQPSLHREDRTDVQHALIEAHPFGLFISTGPDGLLANGLPFILKRDTG